MELSLGDVLNLNGTLGCVIAQTSEIEIVLINQTSLMYASIDEDIVEITNTVPLQYISDELESLSSIVVGNIPLSE